MATGSVERGLATIGRRYCAKVRRGAVGGWSPAAPCFSSLVEPRLRIISDTYSGLRRVMAVKKARERIEDAMREVGTLLIAFAPLDAALSEGRGQMNTLAFLLLFFGLGSLLFVGAVLLERRRSRVS